MQIKLKCPNAGCGKVLLVESSLAGKKGRCSTCGTVFQIPAATRARPAGGPRGETKPAAARKQPSRPAAGPAPTRPRAVPRDRAAPAQPDARRPVKRPPAAASVPPSDDDVLEDALLEDALLEEDESSGAEPPRLQRAAPLPGRRRPAEDEHQDYENYEDYEDDEDSLAGPDNDDDEYEDYEDYEESGPPARRRAARPRRSRPRGMSAAERWSRVSVGMRIAGIALCVYAGAYAINMIGELLFETGFFVMSSALTDAQAGGGMDAYFAARESLESGSSMMKSSGEVFKVSRLLIAAAGAGLLVGYAFLVVAPNRHGAQPLAIATLAVGGVAIVLDLVFRAIPYLTGGRPLDPTLQVVAVGAAIALGALGGSRVERSSQSIFQYISTSDRVMALLLELLSVVALALFAVFLSSAARAHKDRVHSRDCLKIVWALSGYAAILVVVYLFLFVHWGSNSDWVAYLIWVAHWGANGAFLVALVLFIKHAFYSARTTG